MIKIDNYKKTRIQQFKKLIEGSPLPILFTKGLTPIIEYVNPSWEKTTGYKLEEVKGKNPKFLKSDRTSPEIHKKMWEELQKGNTYKTEYLFNKKKDGTEFQLSSSFFPVKISGKPNFYVQIGHDITARKKREKYKNMHINIALVLAQSKKISEAVPKTLEYLCKGTGWEIGELWLIDEEKNILNFQGSWNNKSLKVKKFINQSKEINFEKGRGLPGHVWQTGKPEWIINDPENKYFPKILTQINSEIKTSLAFPIQIDFKTIGVLTFFTRKNHKPNEDLLKTMRSLGSHLGQFIEHKIAEEKLADITTRQQLLLNAIGQGVYGVDKDGFVTFINPAAEKMLGWKFKELMGKRLHDIIHYTKFDKKTIIPYNKCINYEIRHNENKPRHIDKEVFWRKDGTSFPVEYVITPIPEKNNVTGAVVTFSDITKRKELEDLKKEFLTTAAHELKTPITTLKLLSQHNLIKVKKNRTIKTSDLELMNRELDRLIRIINDILDDQRAETGKLNLKIEKVEINSLIKNVTRQMKGLSSKHNIIFKPSEDKTYVAADPDRISQILTNLISNAIKYSPESKNITLKTKLLKHKIHISVSDEGTGIPKEKQQKIFDRFYQIKEGKTGFGLGLYISKQIMKLHKGKIWVKSKVGEGSTFYFSLSTID